MLGLQILILIALFPLQVSQPKKPLFQAPLYTNAVLSSATPIEEPKQEEEAVPAAPMQAIQAQAHKFVNSPPKYYSHKEHEDEVCILSHITRVAIYFNRTRNQLLQKYTYRHLLILMFDKFYLENPLLWTKDLISKFYS